MNWKKHLMATGALLCAATGLSGALALALGVGAACGGANADPERWHRRAHWLLQGSVVALGAGVSLPEVARAGMDGLAVTLVSIVAVLALGNFIGRLLGVPRHTRLLVSAGTAICGGSAIAAIAGVIRPRHHETAAALGIVFVLNAVALAVFPFIGHLFHLSQTAFGWWAALAIHDTSSVVGAGMAYGPQALTLATAIKLARALWIVPLALLVAHREGRHPPVSAEIDAKGARAKIAFPWFILGFVCLAGLRWAEPALSGAGDTVAEVGRHGLSAALFLIGSCLNPAALKKVGRRPALLGIGLWLPTAAAALLFVLFCK